VEIDEPLARRVKLRELRILLAAARRGGLAKAARELGLSQPAVSKAIADLEATVGAKLLDRTPLGVEPTAQGKLLLQRALNVFDELRSAREELAFLADPKRGMLRIGCSHAMSAGLLPEILERLAREHPGIRCNILEADREQLARALKERTVDALLARQFIERPDDELQFEALYEEFIFVVAGKNHPLARRRRLTYRELAAQPWILPTVDPLVRRFVETVFLKLGGSVPEAAITSMSIQVSCSLLAGGRFLALLPGSALLSPAARDSLCVLPVDVSATSSPVGVTTLRHRSVGAATAAFLAIARAVARRMPA
jgi:DNA-binding transcriptional LysR family regulator